MIDHEKLEEIEGWNHGWRVALGSGLSERYVPGEGDNPRVLLVGEAPGAQEDSALRPFVGASGRVLRDLMASCGLFTGLTPHFGEANCWLTNVVHFRPPGNRNPLPSEITVARSGLRGEWVAVGRPRVIVPVGGIAYNAIMRNPDPEKKGTFHRLSILNDAGKPQFVRSRQGEHLTIWPMIHPSFGLRQKDMIPLIEAHWEDFNNWLQDKWGGAGGTL